MSDREYEHREAQEFHKQLQEVEKAPLAYRKEAADDYLQAMKHQPERVAERIDWLLAGNYGYGAMKAAERIVNGRGNRMASLSIIIAALEYQCPSRMAAAAWKKLTKAERDKLDDAIKTEIAELRKTH